MSSGGLTLEQLAARTRCPPDVLEEALADELALGRVERDELGRFHLARAGAPLGETLLAIRMSDQRERGARNGNHGNT